MKIRTECEFKEKLRNDCSPKTVLFALYECSFDVSAAQEYKLYGSIIKDMDSKVCRGVLFHSVGSSVRKGM